MKAKFTQIYDALNINLRNKLGNLGPNLQILVLLPGKSFLNKFLLKFLVLSSIFFKFRFYCRRQDVWNKFRK